MKKIKLFVLVIGVLIAQKAVFAQKNIAGYYTYKTELLASELDGTLTVKAWGKGKNKKDAMHQAYKNAVYDVLFNGLNDKLNNRPVKALVLRVNAREYYNEYFNKFFQDGGDYNKFVNKRDGKQEVTMGKKKSEAQVTCGVVLLVNIPKLQKELKKENIIL
nr:hypothetical protein [uncultured Carboxylicivirga sp.]